LSLLAAKGLGALLGGLLVAAQNLPGFSEPALRVRAETLWVETRLERAFNKNLDQVLISGSPVAVQFTFVLQTRDEQGGVMVAEPVTVLHSAAYDPRDRRFRLYRSELAGQPDSVVAVETGREAKRLLAAVLVPVAATAVLPAGCELQCRVEAALNTITLEAPETRELDLNAFWNYRYPRAATAWTRLEAR
jgi:hypothetical protein